MAKRNPKYDDRMDPECIPICDALNALPGIRTFESCCGHGKRPFMVFFRATKIAYLRPILMEVHDRRGWTLEAQWANGGDTIYFMLCGWHIDHEESKKNIYREANEIAEALK